MEVKTHVFNGVMFHIGVDDPYMGWCDNPDMSRNNDEYPAIRMPDGLPCGNGRKAKEGLIILLHECRHAQDYSLSEKQVDREADELGTILWRLGYRRMK